MTDFVATLATKCEQAHQEIILVCGHNADCPQEWEEFPEKYGPCNCQMVAVKTTLDDLVAAAISEALEAERANIVIYLRQTLAVNHPHLHDAYEHAAKNIEAGAATIAALLEGR